MIGNDLESLREALSSNASDTLHLLERINIDLEVQNSIVPSALNLARFKVAGKLPTLQVNLSDAKYKSIMRLVDVCIPNFDDDADSKKVTLATPATPSVPPRGFQLPSGLFGTPETEYNVDDAADSDCGADDSSSEGEQFFEADDGAEVLRQLSGHKMNLTSFLEARTPPARF